MGMGPAGAATIVLTIISVGFPHHRNADLCEDVDWEDNHS